MSGCSTTRLPGRGSTRCPPGPQCRTTPAAPHPQGHPGLLGALEDVLDIVIARGDLEEDARAWERGVDELAASDAEVAEYVSSLEDESDAAELPEASGDAIAREFGRYLRYLETPEEPEA